MRFPDFSVDGETDPEFPPFVKGPMVVSRRAKGGKAWTFTVLCKLHHTDSVPPSLPRWCQMARDSAVKARLREDGAPNIQLVRNVAHEIVIDLYALEDDNQVLIAKGVQATVRRACLQVDEGKMHAVYTLHCSTDADLSELCGCDVGLSWKMAQPELPLNGAAPHDDLPAEPEAPARDTKRQPRKKPATSTATA